MNWKHQSELLRTKRRIKGLSQAQMDTHMGNLKKNKGQHFSNLERGKSGIPLKHAKVLCEVLEITHQELIGAMVRDYQASLIRAIWVQERPELAHVKPQIVAPPLPEMVEGDAV